MTTNQLTPADIPHLLARGNVLMAQHVQQQAILDRHEETKGETYHILLPRLSLTQAQTPVDTVNPHG